MGCIKYWSNSSSGLRFQRDLMRCIDSPPLNALKKSHWFVLDDSYCDLCIPSRVYIRLYYLFLSFFLIYFRFLGSWVWCYSTHSGPKSSLDIIIAEKKTCSDQTIHKSMATWLLDEGMKDIKLLSVGSWWIILYNSSKSYRVECGDSKKYDQFQSINRRKGDLIGPNHAN